MSTNHILPLPKAVFALKIVQLVIAIVVLGLAAYGVTFIAFDGDSLMLFTTLATIIIAVYYIIATTALTSAYNYWAILGLDIFGIIFWLISFALLAWEVAVFGWGLYDYGYSGGSTCYDYPYCTKKRDVSSVIGKRATMDVYTYRNALAAAAGLGGLEFILFIVTLVITSIYLHRHRKAGGHCMPGALHTAPVTQEQKGVELQGQQQQQYYPAPPQHDQQVTSV
ncbi:hypothetical protein VE00_08992 [Pseudogymnoascus sp. WSF 3629]|nr:hypothetical protein VE00_08992 [Pseudogymnoascus sp. WSF 3629]